MSFSSGCAAQEQQLIVNSSMSEYGCITNTRTFAETTALYQPDMTGVFSGGLVYEYAQEENNYGLVNINGNSVSPVGSQMTDLENALAGVQDPSNGGGYTTDNGPQDCPPQGDNWDTSPYSGSQLPAFPSGAAKYMRDGAGKGPGLGGSGSQEAGTGDVGTAGPGAGSVTATYGSGPTGGSTSGSSSASSSSAAAIPLVLIHSDLRPMMACGIVAALSFSIGAVLL